MAVFWEEVEGGRTTQPTLEGGVSPTLQTSWEGKGDETGEWTLRLLIDERSELVKWEAMNLSLQCRSSVMLDKDGLLASKMDPRLEFHELVLCARKLCESGQISIEYDKDNTEEVTMTLIDTINGGSGKTFLYSFRLNSDEWDPKDTLIAELRKENAHLKEQLAQLSPDQKEQQRLIEHLARMESEKREVQDTVVRLTRDMGDEIEKMTQMQSEMDHLKEKVINHGLVGWDSPLKRGWGGRTSELDSQGNPLFIAKLDNFLKTNDEWDVMHSKYLFSHRVSIKADAKFTGKSDSGSLTRRNALQFCAQHSCLIDMFQWLLNDGNIDPNDCSDDEQKYHSLIIAAAYDNIDAAGLLIQDGRIDKNLANMWGWNALMIAVYFGNRSMVSYLLDQECDTETRDKSGKNALDYARERGHSELAELILQKQFKK